jgi:hypothetical protein
MESILAYRLFHWKRITQDNKKRKESFERYKRRMKEWKNYRPGRPSVLDLPDTEEEETLEDVNGGMMEEPSEQESSTKVRVFAGFRSKVGNFLLCMQLISQI